MDMYAYTQLDAGIICVIHSCFGTHSTRRMYTHARGGSQELFAVECYWWGCGSDGEREAKEQHSRCADSCSQATLCMFNTTPADPGSVEHRRAQLPSSVHLCLTKPYLPPQQQIWVAYVYGEIEGGKSHSAELEVGEMAHGLWARPQSQLLRCVHITEISAKNIVNSVEYEAHLTEKSVSNQTAFCRSMQPTL